MREQKQKNATSQMTTAEVMEYLEAKGSEQTRKVYRNHGLTGEAFGVKIADLKTLQKKIKKDHALALELYETGNADAQYLASLISEPQEFTKTELNRWAKNATWYMVSEYAVAWAAAESRFAWELATKWIESKQPHVASSGWATLSSFVSLTDDDLLPLEALTELLTQVEQTLEKAPNRVRYAMNGFVIALGSYVKPLEKLALATARTIGKVTVDMVGTACKVPLAEEYILKMAEKNRVGIKRKSAFC